MAGPIFKLRDAVAATAEYGAMQIDWIPQSAHSFEYAIPVSKYALAGEAVQDANEDGLPTTIKWDLTGHR